MSPPENDTQEYQRLASQMVDMWQKNITSMMNDGDFIRTLLHMMQHSSFGTKDFSYEAYTAQSSPARAATASNPRDAAITDLKNTVFQLERRILLLEQALGGLSAKRTTRTPAKSARNTRKPETGAGSRNRSKKTGK